MNIFPLKLLFKILIMYEEIDIWYILKQKVFQTHWICCVEITVKAGFFLSLPGRLLMIRVSCEVFYCVLKNGGREYQ